MCRICEEESGQQGYVPDDFYDDVSKTEFVFFLLFIPPLLAWMWVRDAVFGGARRRARADRTRLTREQKKIFKDWAGR